MIKKEWKVYFSGNFWGHKKRERCCKEIPVKKEFLWNGEKCYIPAVYTCPRGMVVDFCKEVSAKRIQAFLRKWWLLEDQIFSTEGQMMEVKAALAREREFTEEERQQIEQENPLVWDFRPYVYVNGKELEQGGGCSVSWNPCLPNEAKSEIEAETVLDHYKLDKKQGWNIWRFMFRWNTKMKPILQNIRVELKSSPTEISGSRFMVERAGDEVSFHHPITGTEHVLKVIEFSDQTMEKDPFPEKHMEWPTHFKQLKYTLTPELSDVKFRVFDCAGSDSPKKRPEPGYDGSGRNASARSRVSSIGIIGGAYGPTSIFLAGKGRENAHLAFSSLHFEPVSSVEWRMTFYEKLQEDMEVKIV